MAKDPHVIASELVEDSINVLQNRRGFINTLDRLDDSVRDNLADALAARYGETLLEHGIGREDGCPPEIEREELRGEDVVPVLLFDDDEDCYHDHGEVGRLNIALGRLVREEDAREHGYTKCQQCFD